MPPSRRSTAPSRDSSANRSSASRPTAPARDPAPVERTLAELQADAAAAGRNLLPPIIEAARAGATVGEICDAFRDVWGAWRETPVF